MSARSEKLASKGWTDEGRRLLDAARSKGMCAQCGTKLRSKYPIGDRRRRSFCWNQGNYPNRCTDIFFRKHFQSWAATKYAVLARARGADRKLRCEQCRQEPKPTRRVAERQWEKSVEEHCGYEFDHTVELACGGDPLDPANVRLLCLRCHRRKTARFLRRGTPSARPEKLTPLEAFSPGADTER